MGLYEELLALTEGDLIGTHDAQRSRLDSEAISDAADPDVTMDTKMTGIYSAFGRLAQRLSEQAWTNGEPEQFVNGMLIGSLLTSWILLDVAEQQKLTDLVMQQTGSSGR